MEKIEPGQGILPDAVAAQEKAADESPGVDRPR